MWYWNKDNFASLAQLAEELKNTPELAKLADYCSLREKGLRKQAMAALRAFLQECADFPKERRLALAAHLLELHWRAPGAHQFLAQPLIDGFLLPVLNEEAHPGNTAFRNLALLQAEFANGAEVKEDLFLALQHNPSDIMVRKRLTGLLLDEADYAMHHLNESFFIGSEEYCRKVLDQAGVLLEPTLANPGSFDFFVKEHQALSNKLADWLEYSRKKQEMDFPEWCASNGREHAWYLRSTITNLVNKLPSAVIF